MNRKEQAKKIRAMNSEARTFWSTHQKRFENLVEERPQVVSDALADFNDEARRRGFSKTPSLEYFVEKVSKRRLSPKKRGRPRQQAIRQRVKELKQDHSWSEVKAIIDKETGWPLSISSYRNFAR
jgi:hypothetical protein